MNETVFLSCVKYSEGEGKGTGDDGGGFDVEVSCCGVVLC